MPKTLANPTKFTSLHSCLPCALRNELTLCYFFLPTAGDFGQISLSPQFTNGNMLPLIPYPWVKQQVLAGPVQLGPIRNKSLVLLHVSNPAWLTAWRTLGIFTGATICGCRFQSRFYQCNSCEHHNTRSPINRNLLEPRVWIHHSLSSHLSLPQRIYIIKKDALGI